MSATTASDGQTKAADTRRTSSAPAAAKNPVTRTRACKGSAAGWIPPMKWNAVESSPGSSGG
jgi:hypothetical protein